MNQMFDSFCKKIWTVFNIGNNEKSFLSAESAYEASHDTEE